MVCIFLGACANPLGLGWDFTLPDSAFSASSEMSPGEKRSYVLPCYSQTVNMQCAGIELSAVLAN